MTVGGLSASPPSIIYSQTPSKILNSPFPKPPWSSSVAIPRFGPKLNLITTTRFAGASSNLSFRCNNSTGPGGSGSGDGDSRSVLDAFFVGKALAEALNERIESTVGEFLSAIGRLQAEQQKQVQDFQEEVLERAKKAKEKAAREAMEAQGLVSKSSTADESAVIIGDTTTNTPSVTDTVTPAISASSSSSSSPTTDANIDPNPIDE